ncbi:hypothetical protein [Pseudonocardia sp. 73-21]|uniref:hypothetical protein n=1 Tax=Pseudonocardia sp. 73-21 TaxID=1895809 RepID=UPI002631B40A|nr:hypothetical protein [Pseudonocardia sp. 73-21]
MSVPAAVVLLAVLVLLGLAVDGVRAAQVIATADAIAGEAARAGGQAVDVAALARGATAVDPTAAAAAARGYLKSAGVTGTVDLDGADTIRVEVTVTRPTVLLGLAGRPTITGHGSASARLVPVDPGGAP